MPLPTAERGRLRLLQTTVGRGALVLRDKPGDGAALGQHAVRRQRETATG
jgi:hypothetical protein